MDRVVRTGEPGSAERRVVVHPSRTRQVLAAAGALAFVLIGCWLLTFGDPLPVVAGGLAVVVFGVFSVLLVLRLVDRRPALVLDRDGLHDNASALAAGLIPWSEMTQVGTLVYRGQRMLGINVVDPGALLDRVHPLKRRALRANIGLVGAVVNIPQNTLPVDVDEVIAEMRTFLGPGR